jgi:NAD(P)-dependent dehydrogenase (short-subunit alcohol dehydrogenase family)
MTARYDSLRDRTVLVTGGASGIGAAVVSAFARNGARVAFLDIDAASGDALVATLREAEHAPLFLPCDLTDIPALRDAVAEVGARLGPVAALVNNAADDARGEVDAITPDDWDRSFAVNLRHQAFAAQAVRPQMRALGGGAIVNLTSIAWMGGATGMLAYATAKSGVIGLTRSLAREFGPDNIRVNAVAPGAVMTPRQMRLWHTPESAALLVQRQAIRAPVTEADIAATILFLCAEESRMITKQCLIVDGGLA